ncbi:pentatricopeptide repeat-containing protein At2g37320-like [Coffea arabica]|uniref:Pentatricopeptide repeat-containing protein At2g37320-like n=1 Tax=Coffea arabica TaxID=13443 RepID=A0ABM4ULK2_COFAR
MLRNPPKTKTLVVKGQRVLDIIASKPDVVRNRKNHLRLVDDFLRTTNSLQFPESQGGRIGNPPNTNESSKVLELFRRHQQGLSVGPSVLSNALSLCGSERAVSAGIQMHGLAVINGFLCNVYVGSSLITFYSKCGVLNSAYKVFDEMPTRNIVSWTAIINGFAQECRIDICWQLYRKMRDLTLKPNAFTFASFLCACTGSGCLGKGRSVHCQTILTGFDCYIHVANALISMYCKCGSVEDALAIFWETDNRDLVSWNSMIAGYALHGLALKAVGLFEEMTHQRVKPDAITFLGILTSCRHAGLVKQGRFFFNLMAEYGVNPGQDHYSCIVDLLGRAGMLEEARDFIKRMPISPNAVIWGSLLSSCRLHENVWAGIEAAENRLLLKPSCAVTHLQLANLYASVGYWDQAARVRKLMKDKCLKTDPGRSWVEIKNGVYHFRAEDISNSNYTHILAMMDSLVDHMRCFGHLPIIFEETDYP